MTSPLPDLLSDLAELMARVRPTDAPTPCPEYDLAALRQHVLGWLPVFAAALTDPDGEQPRPDPQAYRAPADASAAAAQVADVAKQVTGALDEGVLDRSVQFLGGPMPGSMLADMLTGEVIAHGWDLARAAGLAWDPSPAACESTLATLRRLLTPQFRGPGQGFGAEVAVPDDATPLDRLLAFTGRDPGWSPRP